MNWEQFSDASSISELHSHTELLRDELERLWLSGDGHNNVGGLYGMQRFELPGVIGYLPPPIRPSWCAYANEIVCHVVLVGHVALAAQVIIVAVAALPANAPDARHAASVAPDISMTHSWRHKTDRSLLKIRAS